MEKLTHRERVLLALDHKEADRIPIDLLGSATLIVDKTYFDLLDYLGLNKEVKPWRKGFTANYYDERILRKFDIDFRRVFMPLTSAGAMKYIDEDTYICPWGIRWQKKGQYVHSDKLPLAGLDIDEIIKYDWPKPQNVWNTRGLQEKVEYLYKNTTYALVARNPVTFGLLDRGCALRGMAQFMMDLAGDPDLAKEIIDNIMKVHLGMYDMFLKEVGEYVEVVETADDLGGQEHLLISPAFYREFLKPAQKKINSIIKSRAPKARIFFHSDGAINRIIPDLIEIGVDILNPVQPSADGMESDQLKKEFGGELVFHGGVDQMAQEGSKEDIIEEVRTRIDAFAPGGGYVLSTCNNILGASPANIVNMFNEAAQYGKY